MISSEVKERIESCLVGSICYVSEFSGGSDHYSVIVISDDFESKTLLTRHRMVMELFKDEVESEEVHALSIKAFTKKQWEAEKSNSIKIA